jgi:glycosyltransferase 2 family protein
VVRATASAPRLWLTAIMGRWRLLLGLAISAAFLLWAFRQASSISAVAGALRDANYLWTVPALAAYFVGVWFRTVRWRLLLGPLCRLSVARLFPIVVVGYMANNVLPARLGEFVRAYILGEREGVSKSAVLATIFIERTFDGLTMILFMLAVGLTIALDDTLKGILYSSGAIFVVAVAAFIGVAAAPRPAVALLGRLTSPLPARVRDVADHIAARFVEGLGSLGSVTNVLAVLGLSLLAWTAEATMYLLVGLGFGLKVGPNAYFLTTAVANIGGMLPSSPGYVGTFEWFATTALSAFGLQPDIALSYVLALHALLLLPVTLLGFVYLWRLGISLRVLTATGSRGA